MPVLKITEIRQFQDKLALNVYLKHCIVEQAAIIKLLKQKKLTIISRWLTTEYEVSDDVNS